MHYPYAHGPSIKKFLKLVEELKPDVVTQIGDSLDLFSFSRFPRSFNHLTPKEELEDGLGMIADFWERVKKLSPKSKCIQLLGNHDERLNKSVLVSLPAAESLLNVKTLLTFPKVETISSEREEVIIDDIMLMHGYRSKLGDHAWHNGMKTICGHSHQGGVVFHRLGDKVIWELNAGFLADAESHALSYTRQKRISKWTLGCGYVDELGPRFIPFEV